MVVLAHLQGVAATFRVGRHHHRGPLYEGRGLTHALTHTAPTDLTVAAALGEEGLLQAAALAPLVETGESEDVRTRVRPHCDGTGLCRAQIWRSGTHARKQCEIWAQFQPNPLLIAFDPRHVFLFELISRPYSFSRSRTATALLERVSIDLERSTVDRREWGERPDGERAAPAAGGGA